MSANHTFPPSHLSRRDFLVTGSKALAGLSLAGMPLMNGCARHYRPAKNLNPFTIGLLGEHNDFEFYAQVVQNMSSASLYFIDTKAAIQGQTDAVIIAAPLTERAALAIRILKAGSHVLMETPIATSYAEFDAIMRQANQQNKRVAVASFHRFFNSAIQARTLYKGIGKIKVVQIQVDNEMSDPLWSRHKEGFLGMSLPLFDLVRWLCAKSPLSLYTQKNLFAQFVKPEKNLHLFVQLGKIPVLYTTVPTTSPDISASWTITVYGQKGHLKLSANDQLQRADTAGEWETVVAGYSSAYQEAVHDLLVDFIESCQTGKEPEVNLLDGMAGVALTLAAVQSSQSGQAVAMIQPFYGVDEDKLWWREYRELQKARNKTQHTQSKPQPENNTKLRLSRLSTGNLAGDDFEKVQTGIKTPWFEKTKFLKNGLNPLAIADRIARRVMTQYKVYPSYTTDLALEGLLYLYDASGNEKYLNHVLKVWQFREANNAATLNWKILFVCLHFETFLRTGDIKYISTFMEVAKDFRDTIPRDYDGTVAYSIRPEKKRIFIDMLQGYAIFMARAGWLSGDESYFDECVNQYQYFRQILRHPQTGLWHQGRGWGPQSQLISPGHWNRGQGWVLRGMVESLCYLPKHYSKQPLMLQMMTEFAERLITYQDARGMWHQITDHPAAYPETSGTAMFVHYLYRAIQNGWLPKKTYLPVVEKGLNALLGFVHKNGLVSNTSQGSGPLMTQEGYLHRPSVPGDSHSVGTTLMACAAPYLSGIHSHVIA